MACRERLRRRTVALLVASLVPAALPAAPPPPATTLVYPPWGHCYGMHRVTQVHLTVRAGFRAKFDDPQGLAAVKMRAEDDSTTSKDDDELTVLGVNSGQNQIIYNTSLSAIAFYGSAGKGIGQFRAPTGIAADREGNVVVADTGNDRLHVLRYADDRLQHVRFLQPSHEGKRLLRPTGVALEAGELYVCDPNQHRILILDLQGKVLQVLAPAAEGKPLLQQPSAVAAIRARADFNFFGEDFVAVVDSGRARLVQLAPDGRVLAIRRVRELGPQAREFAYVAIDYHANVYCSDGSGRLHKFDRKLRTLLSIGKPGTDEFMFDQPRGIGLYRRFGQIFVAERAGAQYLWTGTDVFTPSLVDLVRGKDGAWNGVVRYFLTEYARVQLELVDAKDQSVIVVQKSRWQAAGPVSTPVSFRLPSTEGALRLRVDAVPTYSSRTYLRVRKHGPPLDLRAAASSP